MGVLYKVFIVYLLVDCCNAPFTYGHSYCHILSQPMIAVLVSGLSRRESCKPSYDYDSIIRLSCTISVVYYRTYTIVYGFPSYLQSYQYDYDTIRIYKSTLGLVECRNDLFTSVS